MAMTKVIVRLWAKRPLFALASGLVLLMALDHFRPGFLWVGGLVFAALVVRFGGWKTGFIGVALAAIVLGGGRLRDARQEADEARFSKFGLAEVEARRRVRLRAVVLVAIGELCLRWLESAAPGGSGERARRASGF